MGVDGIIRGTSFLGGSVSIFSGIKKLFVRPQRKGISFHYINRADILEARRIYGDSVGDGLTSDVIMSPVLWAARRMAESPIGVRKQDDEEIDFEHDAAKLLKRPNGFYSGSALRMALTIEFLLDGNGYALKLRNNMKKPVALSFVPHWLIEPHIPDDGGYVDYYEYTPGGRYGREKILPEDVIHLRNGIDPSNIRKGLSPLKILLREIYTDDEAAIFTAMMLKNGGVPGMVISPAEGGAWVEDIALEKKRVMEEFSGLRKGNPLVMRGPTKIEHYGFDASKLDLSVLREIPEERVTALLGIPAAVVGFGTGLQQTKVGATMQELRAMAYEDCIIPMQNLWADEWDLQLLPDFEEAPENFRMIFDLSNVRVLRDDEGKKSERLTRQLTAGGITLAEWREQLGYEARPEHEVYYLSMATMVVPSSQLGTPEPGIPSPPKSLPAPQLKVRSDPSTARLAHRMRSDWDRLSKKWAAKLTKTFKDLGGEAARRWETFAEERGIKSLKMVEDPEAWALLLSQMLDYKGMEYGSQFLMVGRATFDSINTVLGLGVMLEAPEEMRILSAAGTRKGLVNFEKQTKDALFEAISEGRAAGMGSVELASKIRDMVSAGPWLTPETRAMVIARTETKYAQNVSSLEAYRGMDGLTGIRVFDALLGPTDAECEELNGQVVSVEEAEYLAGSEHPNGTRSFAPYMGEI
jgi:HK97 family phage portal protein